MKGFLGWMRRQPEYNDLTNDAGACGNLKALMADMLKSGACDAAWRMLFNAIYAYPLKLRPEWQREAFKPCVSVDALVYVAIDYVHGPTEGMELMPENEFDALIEPMRLLWQMDPHNAETVINEQRCSSIQYCLLWGLRT